MVSVSVDDLDWTCTCGYRNRHDQKQCSPPCNQPEPDPLHRLVQAACINGHTHSVELHALAAHIERFTASTGGKLVSAALSLTQRVEELGRQPREFSCERCRFKLPNLATTGGDSPAINAPRVLCPQCGYASEPPPSVLRCDRCGWSFDAQQEVLAPK